MPEPLDFTANVDWQVYVETGEDLTALKAATKVLNIVSNVNSLYTTGTWTFNAPSNYIEDGTLIVGKDLTFVFSQDYSPDSVKPLSIFKIEAGPGTSGRTIPGLVTITLISPWYFKQKIGSRAYTGRITDILRTMYDAELSSFILNAEINQSADDILTRWRTYMTPGKFIEDRLRFHMRGENYCPPFIYTDDTHKFVATSTNIVKKSHKKFRAADRALHLVPLSSSDPDYDGDIFINNLKLMVDGGVIWQNTNPGLTYMYSINQYRAVNEPMKGFLKDITPLVIGPGEVGFVPITSKRGLINPGEFTRIIQEDSSQDRSDTVTELLTRYGNELLEGFHLELSCPYVHSAVLGRYISVNLSKDELSTDVFNPSLYTRDWFCTEVSLTIYRGNRAQTTLRVGNTTLTTNLNATDTAKYYVVTGESPIATQGAGTGISL